MSDDDDKQSPSDADDAAFEELINNQGEDEGPVEINTPWDGFEYIWKKFHAGDILVKGIFLAEYIDEEGEHSFGWFTSPDMAPWTASGLLQQAISDMQAENVALIFADLFKKVMKEEEGEEDEDDEDVQ